MVFLMGVFIDHPAGCDVFFIMDSTFVDTFDGIHPAVLPPKRCMKPNL